VRETGKGDGARGEGRPCVGGEGEGDCEGEGGNVAGKAKRREGEGREDGASAASEGERAGAEGRGRENGGRVAVAEGGGGARGAREGGA